MPSATSETHTGPWTIFKILNWTESYFKSFKIDSPRLASEILLCHCLKVKRLDLYLQYDRPLNKKELAAYKNMISRRAEREPVAYITGNKGFWESEFSVSSDVLIPRPDTEVLVEACLDILNNGHGAAQDSGPVPIKKLNILMNNEKSSLVRKISHVKSDNKKKRLEILELGTGSGAVIISLAKIFPANLYFALDISPAAAKSAACNALKILRDTRIFVLAGSWFSALKKQHRFDLIISNPPYIPSKEINSLQPEIRHYEPRIALDGGNDGLKSIREIIDNAWEFLNPNGVLILETGCDQKKEVEKIADNCALYDPVKYIKDYSDHDRVAVLRRNES